MMIFRSFWNHRPGKNRHINGVSRRDYGVIASMDCLDSLPALMTDGARKSIRAASYAHDGSAIDLSDSAWEVFDRDPTMAVAHPSGILVLQQMFPSLGHVDGSVRTNSRRTLWVIVARTRGVGIRRTNIRRHVIMSVSRSKVAAVLPALIHVIARRRSKPMPNCAGLFAASVRGTGSRSPYARSSGGRSERAGSTI